MSVSPRPLACQGTGFNYCWMARARNPDSHTTSWMHNLSGRSWLVHLCGCINLNHKLGAKKGLGNNSIQSLASSGKSVCRVQGLRGNLTVARVAGKWVTGKEEMDQQSPLLYSQIKAWMFHHRDSECAFMSVQFTSYPNIMIARFYWNLHIALWLSVSFGLFPPVVLVCLCLFGYAV